MKEIFPRVCRDGKKLYSASLSPGLRHFAEGIEFFNGVEYRNWDPRSSKLAAVILKGMVPELTANSRVLYLGAAHGYTASYVSDIVEEGFVFAMDFAPRVVRNLVFVAESRSNMAVFLDDAGKPESYYHWIAPVDFVYQDIAQKSQVKIFLKNVDLFLKKGGTAYIAVKARSIDSTQDPRKIFATVKKELETHLKVYDQRFMEPYQKDHCMFACRKK